MEDRPMKEFSSFEEWLESTHKSPDWMSELIGTSSNISQGQKSPLRERSEEKPDAD